jgi:hypothetical protein
LFVVLPPIHVAVVWAKASVGRVTTAARIAAARRREGFFMVGVG